MNISFRSTIGAVGALASFHGLASASVWTASVGTRSAQVEFVVSGDILTAVLTNTSANDVLVPIDVLTAVFFDVSGGTVSLASSSAVVPAGSSVLFGTTDPGNVVGGEWGYGSGLASGAPGGAKHGISSVGLGLFGGATFPGSNLQGPAALDGLQYGITSAGDDPTTGNTPVKGSNALIKNAVRFTFTGATGFDTSRIGNVWFQYGTDLSEPSIPGVPTPGGVAIALAGLTIMGARRRRA